MPRLFRTTRSAAPLVLLGLIAVAMATTAGQDPPRRVTHTLAAYNTENLFDVFDDPYTVDEQTRVKPRAQLVKLAKAMQEVGADVVALSEVENEGVVRAWVAEMLPDAGYDYVCVMPSNSGRGIKVGLLSRLPIVSVTSHRFRDLALPGDGRTWRYARDLLEFTLSLPDGREMTVFSVHFKSKRDSEGDPTSASWRLAEAVMARHVIEQRLADDPDRLLAIMGDFNDTPGSAPIEALLAPGEDGPVLLDAHAGLDADERVTYLSEPYRSTIDFVLVSPALHARLVPGSARVLEDKRLLDGSDHAPVSAGFDLGR